MTSLNDGDEILHHNVVTSDGYSLQTLDPRALHDRWEVAAAAVALARQRGSTAARLAFSVSPEVPAVIANPRYPGMPRCRGDLECDAQNSALALVETYDRWTAEVTAIDRAHGLDELEAVTEAAERELSSVGARLAAIRPASVHEAAWKLEAIVGMPYDDQEAMLDLSAAQSILADLKRLASA